MEIKRLISHFTYRIEPKPEGGFVAHASDSAMPPLEAPTREELQQKIQANIGAALEAEFPGLKLPLENKELKFAFHIEHKPGGGFAIQSTDGKGAPIEGATQAEIENEFVRKIAGLASKHLMPELFQALSAQLGSGEVKVTVNRKVGVSFGSPRLTPGSAGSTLPESVQNADFINAGDNSPITPETNRTWPVIRFLLTLLIIAAIIYFFRHQ